MSKIKENFQISQTSHYYHSPVTFLYYYIDIFSHGDAQRTAIRLRSV